MSETVKLVHYCLLPDLVLLDLKKLRAKTSKEILTQQVMTHALQRYKMQEAGKTFQLYKRSMGDPRIGEVFRQKKNFRVYLQTIKICQYVK